MATTTLASPSPRLFQHVSIGCQLSNAKADGPLFHVRYFCRTKFEFSRSLIYCGSSSMGKRLPLKPISAVGSGLEATITDPDKNLISIKNVEIVVESKDDDKIQVRVDLPGKETQIVFEKVLRNLARSAPPVPGFRREKGSYHDNFEKIFQKGNENFFWLTCVFMCLLDSAGKTSKVPKDFLLQILGEDRVTNFTIQEIVTTTLADYANKENLNVKDNKINTIQTAEELKSLFIPGNDFGFNATLELETVTEVEATVEE